MPKPFELGGVTIKPGERATVDLSVARLYTHSELVIPVHVVHGRRDGPCIFVSAAIHGDEINGVEIIRRLLKLKILGHMRGTLVAIPIVNVFGFIGHSRYLPDRRDLNRAFPGNKSGSLASRLAHLLMTQIISKCDYGVDLHTGSNHRSNFPQIRAYTKDAETKRLASVFGAPFILHSELRDGSLRQALVEKEVPVLLYEAGEAMRFDESSIRIGLRGIINVMRYLKMLANNPQKTSSVVPVTSSSSTWVRAPSSGILRSLVKPGEHIQKDQKMATISDPFGQNETQVIATVNGVVIGQVEMPLVYRGDALYHLASFDGKTLPDSDFEDYLSQWETNWS